VTLIQRPSGLPRVTCFRVSPDMWPHLPIKNWTSLQEPFSCNVNVTLDKVNAERIFTSSIFTNIYLLLTELEVRTVSYK